MYEAVAGERRVAIHVLGAGLGEDLLARMREQHRARSLHEHPHLMEVGELGEAEGIAYLVMERLEGESLASLLGRQGRLPTTHGIDLLLPVIAALSELHRADLPHDDLRLEDIFVVSTTQGTVLPKLQGLGLRFLLDPSTNPSDARADQHATAVILYQAFTGALPHGTRRPRQVIPPSVPLPSIDPELERVILRALAAQPEHRFASIELFGRALAPFASWRGRAAYAALLGIDPKELEGRRAPETNAPADAPRKRAALDTSGAATPIQGIVAPPAREDATQEAPRVSRLSTPMIPSARSTPPTPAVHDGLITAVGLVVLVLVMLGVGMAISPPRSPTPHLATAPARPRPSEAAREADHALGRVVLRTRPPGARIELDGVQVGVGHYQGEAPRDGERHLITVSAEGFVRRQFFLVGPLEREVVLSVVEP